MLHLLITLVLLIAPTFALGHGGGLAADGCHTDHSTGERHCHGGGGGSTGGVTECNIGMTGDVTHVRDGDTIEIGGKGIRLKGVAAPELNEHRGQASKNFMTDLVLGKRVQCIPTGEKTYDRCVATCYRNGADIGATIISAGLARDCPAYSGGLYTPYETAESRQLPLPAYCGGSGSAGSAGGVDPGDTYPVPVRTIAGFVSTLIADEIAATTAPVPRAGSSIRVTIEGSDSVDCAIIRYVDHNLDERDVLWFGTHNPGDSDQTIVQLRIPEPGLHVVSCRTDFDHVEVKLLALEMSYVTEDQTDDFPYGYRLEQLLNRLNSEL